MNIIVVGGAAVGESVVKLALAYGHVVTLIEADEAVAQYCSQTYDTRVLHASIDDEHILDEADACEADALIATTGDDSINLMTMVLGREYNIPNLVSTVNSKHRKSLFEKLGVNALVDPEILAARYLLHLAIFPGQENVTPLAGSGFVYELAVGQESILVEQTIGQLTEGKQLPPDTFIVLVRRDEKHFPPQAKVKLRAHDQLLIYSLDPLEHAELKIFTGQKA